MLPYDDDSENQGTEQERIEPDFPTTTENTEEMLDNFSMNLRDDYRDFKEEFNYWLVNEGKDTFRREGYSQSTARSTHYRIEQVFRWLWSETGRYSIELGVDQADDLVADMVRRTTHPDSEVYRYVKTIKRLFKFYNNQMGFDIPDWNPEERLSMTLKNKTDKGTHSKDHFRPHEFRQLYQAAIEEYSVKSYNAPSMTPDERDRVKRFISQSLGKPKDDVSPEDFKRVSSWKIPSMIAVSCDTGLRPIEVGRAKTDWFDVDQQVMVIPREEATKNDTKWTCAIQKQTTKAVERWLKERAAYDKYRETDAMWLTKYGNSYSSGPLNKLLRKLMDQAGIEHDRPSRSLSWYSIRPVWQLCGHTKWGSPQRRNNSATRKWRRRFGTSPVTRI